MADQRGGERTGSRMTALTLQPPRADVLLFRKRRKAVIAALKAEVEFLRAETKCESKERIQGER